MNQHNNATCCFEQILDVIFYKTAAVQQFISHFINHPSKMNKIYSALLVKDEHVSHVLSWTPTYGQARFGRPARNYLHQLCVDTGCSLKDLSRAMDGWIGWLVGFMAYQHL